MDENSRRYYGDGKEGYSYTSINLSRDRDIPMRKTIGESPVLVAIVDIDDITANFSDYWMRWVQEKVDGKFHKEKDCYSGETALINQFGEIGKNIVKEFYTSHQLLDLPEVAGARELLNTLNWLGFDIHAVTGRPMHIREAVNDSVLWIMNHGLPFRTLNFCGKKDLFVKHFFKHVDISIEDSYEQADSLSSCSTKVYLRNRPHNVKKIDGDFNFKLRRFDEFYQVQIDVVQSYMRERNGKVF